MSEQMSERTARELLVGHGHVSIYAKQPPSEYGSFSAMLDALEPRYSRTYEPQTPVGKMFDWENAPGGSPDDAKRRFVGTDSDPLAVTQVLEASGHAEKPIPRRRIFKDEHGSWRDAKTRELRWAPTPGLENDTEVVDGPDAS